MSRTAAEYNAWYHTRRGAWIANAEFNLMMSMMQPPAGSSLLDVGCGTGHFSRRFAQAGLQVTGMDPDNNALAFAKHQSVDIDYCEGEAQHLPFRDASFDYCSAVTSLCFIDDVNTALREMWRVSRKGVVLGLLNRRSLLYREREQHPGYIGARWDSASDARQWGQQLLMPVSDIRIKTAINFPGGNHLARIVEK
ncbi:MAG: class I SAM-dependent methyltransferase, partial [Acidiferrobacterales bacterium]